MNQKTLTMKLKLKILRGTAATDFTVSDDYEEKGKLQSWNKSSKASNFVTLNKDNNDLKKKWKNKNILNITNKSTLSLHIAAYENSNETVGSDLLDDKNGLKEEKLGSFKTSEHRFTDRLMNPFEFTRQQNENRRNKPKVMQLKPSQRLLDSQSPTTSQQIGYSGEQMPSGASTADLQNYGSEQYVLFNNEYNADKNDTNTFVGISTTHLAEIGKSVVEKAATEIQFQISDMKLKIAENEEKLKQLQQRQQLPTTQPNFEG